MKGFEPPTYGLQIRCSTVELHQQDRYIIEVIIKYIYTLTSLISQCKI